MNEFVSWHMWIKDIFDKICIEDYNFIPKDQRHKKTAFYDKLFDQFLNLNIKRFYVRKGGKINDYNFILQYINKDQIVKLLKCFIVSNKIKTNKNNCKYEKTDEKGYSNIDERMM